MDFKYHRPKQTISFNPPISIEGSWMIRLSVLDVYNSIFNITEENINFDLYTFPVSKIGGTTFQKVKDEIEKDLDFSDNSATDLQEEILGPTTIEEYRKEVSKRMKSDKYIEHFSRLYYIFFQNFESYLRIVVDLVEYDFRLILDEYNSSFINYELQIGIYTFKDISEFLAFII